MSALMDVKPVQATPRHARTRRPPGAGERVTFWQGAWDDGAAMSPLPLRCGWFAQRNAPASWPAVSVRAWGVLPP